MAITNEERKYLEREMIDLLEEYDYEWTDAAIETIIDTWEENKAPLIEAFKTHPNYVEGKFMIAFDTDYDRDVDTRALSSFVSWMMMNRGMIDLPSELKEQINENFDNYLPTELYFFLDSLCNYTDRTFSEEKARRLNEIAPEAHAHAGQKTTRVVNKLCKYLGYDKLPDYNREFAKYADALNPLKITRHTILSLNPIDYLTMSFGNSWSSCHTIDKANKRNMPNGYRGAYSSGTMSYLLDGASMVFYTVDSSYDGTDYFTQPKITRQMYHYGEDKLVQGRLYPANGCSADDVYKQYRNVVQEIIAQLLNVPNLWTLRKGTNPISSVVYSHGTHYTDYNHFDECTLSLLKESENENYIDIGYEPICVTCGCTHDREDTISCCKSGDYQCADCGEWIYEDDVRWVDGEPYCCDCADWCEYCEEYHRSEVYYVRGYGNVCEHCLGEYFTYCDCCEEYIHNDYARYIDNEDRYVCDSCYEEYYYPCAECGEVYHKADMFEHNGDYYCEDCWEAGIDDEIDEIEEEAV